MVDFRLKDSLAYRLETGGIPLVYPHCVTIGQVRPPLHRAADYGDARSNGIGAIESGGGWIVSRLNYELSCAPA